MPTDLEKLVELQAVDLELARLNAQLAAIPKTIARIDAQLASARKRVEDARAAIKAGETAKRQYEQEIRSLNEKILKFRGQSSSIKNNEQYKALLSEIAHAEGEIAGYEEKILELMMNADSLAVATGCRGSRAQGRVRRGGTPEDRGREGRRVGPDGRGQGAGPGARRCARAWTIHCWRPMTAF